VFVQIGETDQAEQESRGQYRQQRVQQRWRNHARQHRQTQQKDQVCHHDDNYREIAQRVVAAAVSGVDQGGCGARHQSTEETEQRRAVTRAHQAQRDIAGKADPGDQNDNSPDFPRVEDVVRTVLRVRQNRQHDEHQDGELQHRNQVATVQPLADSPQLRLEVQQHHGDDRQHDRRLRIVVPDHGGKPVADQNGDDGGGAGFRTVILDVGGNHHGADQNHAGDQRPWRAGVLGQKRGQRTEQSHQCEGAQSGFRHRMTLALESDQQPDRKRGKKSREPFQVGALKPGDLHFLLSPPPVATTG
jgi:hypothetical protein